MRKRGLSCRPVRVRPSVCHVGVLYPGGTGISELMRGLATLTQGGSSLQWSETGMENPQEDPPGSVLFLCV